MLNFFLLSGLDFDLVLELLPRVIPVYPSSEDWRLQFGTEVTKIQIPSPYETIIPKSHGQSLPNCENMGHWPNIDSWLSAGASGVSIKIYLETSWGNLPVILGFSPLIGSRWNPHDDAKVHSLFMSPGYDLDLNPGQYRNQPEGSRWHGLDVAQMFYNIAKRLFLGMHFDEAYGISETHDKDCYAHKDDGSKIFHWKKYASEQIVILPFEENRETTDLESENWSWRVAMPTSVVFPSLSTQPQPHPISPKPLNHHETPPIP